MRLEDFDYELPVELIAQHPEKGRDKCRLMVLDRKGRTVSHSVFEKIVDHFTEKDALVLNDTKVIPARLFGKRQSGGKVEIFLLETKTPVSEALLRPAARLKDGETILLESGDEATILSRGEVGRFVKFSRPVKDILDEVGHIPLPPYIGRSDELSDRSDYQTVYAANEGATACPTAGLHFTEDTIEAIKRKGTRVYFVTLHTNYGTFAPVKSDTVEEHRMHKEYFRLPDKVAGEIVRVKRDGGSVFAVGTTSARVLEHCAGPILNGPEGDAKACSGYTDLFIYPGYDFKVVDHLITNFHLPKSTLLMLVSAFAGREFIRGAYRQAIESRYRFFSYGDAMLIL